MSDHVDGPRSIGEPTADLTDLFAFTSPENPTRTVLAACVFPSAGQNAVFSNVIEYSIVVRRVTLAGIGSAARFQPGDEEIRFSFRFEVLERDAAGKVFQRGVCKLPGGRALPLVVNEVDGASTPEGDFRVFVGLRSDPFFLAWISSTLQRVPNLLEHDNVLGLVVEMDTNRALDPGRGSLFGAVAETVPVPQPHSPVGHPVRRIDWVGRPEQTNIRLTNSALQGADDLRDLWNQQTPFALPKELQPLFRQRLEDSFRNWDLRDGQADWSAEALSANANVFLDDFLLFDVHKPITDQSHLEIEKSTLNGRSYQTGGGRTVDANVIDILLTWLVNHDREFLQGGATGATQPAMKVFPYLAKPNAELQLVSASVELAASPDEVWSLIGKFNIDWHPLATRIGLVGTGVGQLRTIETLDNEEFVERLEELDGVLRFYRYTLVAGVPASHYSGTLEVKPKGRGCVVDWRVRFLPSGQPAIVVRTTVSAWLSTGLENLKGRFGLLNDRPR